MSQDTSASEGNQSSGSSSGASGGAVGRAKHNFWEIKFVVTIAILIILALISAYLEYSVYPSIMISDFFASQVSLRFSFLTYSYTYHDCQRLQCTPIQGLPAFDFAQLFSLIVIIALVYRYVQFRK